MALPLSPPPIREAAESENRCRLVSGRGLLETFLSDLCSWMKTCCLLVI